MANEKYQCSHKNSISAERIRLTILVFIIWLGRWFRNQTFDEDVRCNVDEIKQLIHEDDKKSKDVK